MENESENSSRVIYITGFALDGSPLIGGVWKMWHQQGFPLEMSHLVCAGKGWRVDWLDAMADASISGNLPSLMKHVESFLANEVIEQLKTGFIRAIRGGKTYEQIVEEKHRELDYIE